jgi:UDP-N-acetylmuramyl pentapeptide phosphotransferase/UDP-N-acetylglucosamine-1-phosphate transferase
MIAANAAIAVATIANSWMLAWYDKKDKAGKEVNPKFANSAPKRRVPRWLGYSLIFVFSLASLVISAFLPNPSVNIQILQVSLSVGFLVLAITFSLISPMLEIMNEHWRATEGTLDLVKGVIDSLPKIKDPTKLE